MRHAIQGRHLQEEFRGCSEVPRRDRGPKDRLEGKGRLSGLRR